MVSLEPFVLRIKPAMDSFLRAPNNKTLEVLEKELSKFDWIQMKIFHVQILMPLILKLEELQSSNQEISTGIINCIRLVVSKLYLHEVKALRTLLVVVLKQIRNKYENNLSVKPNLSEEMKLAAVQCMSTAMQRSTTDVLELFYTSETSMLLGDVLLTLVEFIETEKYRKLIVSSIECLRTVFYVHETADAMDLVLRSQVANTLFVFLPKVVSVLFIISLSDEKLGESIKSNAIKTLGLILCLMFEETRKPVVSLCTNSDIKELVDEVLNGCPSRLHNSNMYKKKSGKELEMQLKRLQEQGRSEEWFDETSQRLKSMLMETIILRSHQSIRIRKEYAQMCCTLIEKCTRNLKDNFICLLENVVAMSEDEEPSIRELCQKTLNRLQRNDDHEGLFDEKAELLFDVHIRKLPRIINRCYDAEQYAEFAFLKGFVRNISKTKLLDLFTIPKNIELICMCLISAISLQAPRHFLHEEYSLREPTNDTDYAECAKLHWRQYKYLSSQRCIQTVIEICDILGSIDILNRILFDFLMELLLQQNEAMNEILLLMLWISTAAVKSKNVNHTELVDMLLDELLHDKHWQLVLQPDELFRLKVDKPTNWFVDRTPGLYESAIEVRTQDYDSDDDDTVDDVRKNHVTMADAQFNVLHSCIVMDVLGHCAQCIEGTFDKYVFRSLHKVLLKIASSNSIVHQAATFALVSMQKALKFMEISHFIELNADYLSYHLNTILKKSPDSSSAVEILTVVLQFSSPKTLPHLDSIFHTIRDECIKSTQSSNITSYLRVYNAFLVHISRWESICKEKFETAPTTMDIEEETDFYTDWLNILKETNVNLSSEMMEEAPSIETNKQDEDTPEAGADEATEENITKAQLPRHIEMIKDILHQTFKLVSSSEKSFQILSLECLITGVPLLTDYEDELLPLVHLIWQPLVEKFRQKDALVLNRCFTLLSVLATHAKDFILKRSLDDVIPFLKRFLKDAAAHSATETMKTHSQEYKLQLKLLQEFVNLIECLQISGRHLNEIFEVIALYLSRMQPKQFQECAIKFFSTMRFYNGPLVYLVIIKKSHISEYQENTKRVCDFWKF